MKCPLIILFTLAALFSLAFGSAIAVDNASIVPWDNARTLTSLTPSPANTTGDSRATYSGTIRLQIVEPVSRWRDDNNHTYEFGLLDYALIDAFSVADGQTWEAQATWNSALNGLGSISQNNIMVQSVVFNPTPHAGYSDPPSGGPYTAYYSDAAAQAEIGAPGMNSTAGGTSHTVLVEEATATW